MTLEIRAMLRALTGNAQGGALVTEDSGNVKIAGKGRVATTYAAILASCDASCPFLDKGCYGQGGKVAMVERRVEASWMISGGDTRDVARAEARAIDSAFGGGAIPRDGARGGRDLRLHTVGDCRTPSAARTLAAAALRWLRRGGGAVWSYTHAWRRVPRAAWGGVSILASCESVDQFASARAQGYAPAIVVDRHASPNAYLASDGVTRVIPCPAQTQADVACSECRLCMDADGLFRRNAAIAFEAHGVGAGKARASLVSLGRR